MESSHPTFLCVWLVDKVGWNDPHMKMFFSMLDEGSQNLVECIHPTWDVRITVSPICKKVRWSHHNHEN